METGGIYSVFRMDKLESAVRLEKLDILVSENLLSS